jgi:hypothetical protein
LCDKLKFRRFDYTGRSIMADRAKEYPQRGDYFGIRISDFGFVYAPHFVAGSITGGDHV